MQCIEKLFFIKGTIVVNVISKAIISERNVHLVYLIVWRRRLTLNPVAPTWGKKCKFGLQPPASSKKVQSWSVAVILFFYFMEKVIFLIFSNNWIWLGVSYFSYFQVFGLEVTDWTTVQNPKCLALKTSVQLGWQKFSWTVKIWTMLDEKLKF